MPLNLEPRNDDFTPYLKFNAKSGRWSVRNDVGEEVEVTDLVAIYDLEQIRTGWIDFAEGEAPKTYWDVNGAVAPKPLDVPKAKRGFAVNIFAPKLGGLREFSATSNGACIAVRDLYNSQFESAAERQQGKVPVVKCERILPVKSKFGTNYEPVLKIVKWVDRPAGLPLEAPVAQLKTKTTPPRPSLDDEPASSKPSSSRPQQDDFGLDDELNDELPDFA